MCSKYNIILNLKIYEEFKVYFKYAEKGKMKMVVELDKESICINQEADRKKEVFQVENDMIVNDIKPDVLNIINTSGIICLSKKEIVDGKLKLEGEINTYIIYLADDEKGSTRSLNNVVNFSEKIDLPNYKDNMIENIAINLKGVEANVINGRKINIKAFVEVQTNLYENMNLEVVNNVDSIENIKALKTNEQILSLLGSGTNKASAKDTLSINETDDIAEIMKVNFKLVNREVKNSYNKVLVKAEADVEILYLTEDDRINSVNARIPIMGFVDMPNVNDDCKYNLSDFVNKIIVKPNNSEEHSIYVEAEIEFSIKVFELKNIDIVEDLYSVSDNANFQGTNVNTIIRQETIQDETKIKEHMEIPELDNATICSSKITPEIKKESIENGTICYEGEIGVEILYVKDNKLNNKKITIPFNFEISSNYINDNISETTNINVSNDNFIITQNGALDINMMLEFEVLVTESKRLSLIKDINIEECTNKNPYSMVIYFVKQGDTLWKIAKKFRTTVEDIARVNEIENENKISVGKQLYIPKFVNCNG